MVKKMKTKAINILPGWITTTGAATIIVNAIQAYFTGAMSGQEALFQAGIGIIGIGLRRAIARAAQAISL